MTYIQECESLAGKGEAETWNSFYLVFFWGEPVQGAEQKAWNNDDITYKGV